MLWPFTLNNDFAGLNPLSQIDANFAAAIASIDSLADLRGLPTAPAGYQPVLVLGTAAAFDGGVVGIFAWDVTSTDADNGINIIKITAVTLGRYRKIF